MQGEGAGGADFMQDPSGQNNIPMGAVESPEIGVPEPRLKPMTEGDRRRAEGFAPMDIGIVGLCRDSSITTSYLLHSIQILLLFLYNPLESHRLPFSLLTLSPKPFDSE